MLKINRLRVEIISATTLLDDGRKYGFDFTFEEGFNIVAGLNSRGKTTINTCIYYALGMEELLGAKNEKALDKSLKETFTIVSDEGTAVPQDVVVSKVILEVQSGDRIATIIRYIKPDINSNAPKFAFVYGSAFDNLVEVEKEKFYLRDEGDNDSAHGFYRWLAEFAELKIPTVSNSSRKDDYSPLYLQLIFAGIFIEQTKGWSDFFATMPFFGVVRAKEKVVEFLLDLNELSISTKRDVIKKKIALLSEQWKKQIQILSLIASEYDGRVSKIPEEITVDKDSVDDTKLIFRITENSEEFLNQILTRTKTELKTLNNTPIPKVKENLPELGQKYEIEKAEYDELKSYVENYRLRQSLEIEQVEDLEKEQKRITKEIKDHQALVRVFDENIINRQGQNICPTCKQNVSLDLISQENIHIPKLSLDQNIAFLQGQRKLVNSSLESLINLLEEKDKIYNHLLVNLRRKEDKIRSISRDLISDDRAFSEVEVRKRVELEQQIADFTTINERAERVKNKLKVLSQQFSNEKIKESKLTNEESQDERKINTFETYYKRLLYDFGYESNPRFQISISRSAPFKYFPVYKTNPKDNLPQSIRINSSASDFVRNLWAYTISLLSTSEMHPGLIIFDEPGQHRTNISSLKSLFKACSEEKKKQIFVFTSIEKEINDKKEKIDLEILLEGINENDYRLYKLDNNRKVIQALEN